MNPPVQSAIVEKNLRPVSPAGQSSNIVLTGSGEALSVIKYQLSSISTKYSWRSGTGARFLWNMSLSCEKGDKVELKEIKQK